VWCSDSSHCNSSMILCILLGMPWVSFMKLSSLNYVSKLWAFYKSFLLWTLACSGNCPITTLQLRLISFTNFNAQFFYSLTICMLRYNPPHVLSINMPIFRRTNCIITASGIITLCTVQYSMPDESRLCRVYSHPAYCAAIYREWWYQMLW
jgi:hypothetical protein